MKVKDLMEKLAQMNPSADLLVEGFEDEVETSEEEIETPAETEEEVSVWDREVPEDAYADEQSKGVHEIIKTAHKHGLGNTGKMKTPGGDKDSSDAGIYYDENKNNATDLKKLKLIAKWKWIESGFQPNFGGHLDDEIELPKFEEYRQKYNAWKEENGWNQMEDLFDERAGIDYTFDDVHFEEAEEAYDDEELDECGSACGKINEWFDFSKYSKDLPVKELKKWTEEEIAEKFPAEVWERIPVHSLEEIEKYAPDFNLQTCFGAEEATKEGAEQIARQLAKGETFILKNKETGEVRVWQPSTGMLADERDCLIEESAESIEARLNEQMKTDYQKDLESISDFLF